MNSQSPQHHRAPTILTVPGFNNSGPAHWQTLWEQSRSDTRRAELGMWATPHRNVWVTKLDQAIRDAHGPVILAAHSLGAIAVAWWAALAGQPQGYPVAGALLVAPADVDNSASPSDLSGFAPTPDAPLPFPSILVASTDDPWITIDRARSLAVAWGSHFVDAGPQGHLNAVSARSLGRRPGAAGPTDRRRQRRTGPPARAVGRTVAARDQHCASVFNPALGR